MKNRNSQPNDGPSVHHSGVIGSTVDAAVAMDNSADQAGFTLLETAISMVLLAIVGLGIASIFFFAAKNNVSAGDRQLAMAVAQQSMEQLRNQQFVTLNATVSAGTSTTIIRAGRRYVVNTIITDSSSVNGSVVSKTLKVRVTPWSDGSSWARNVSSIFGSVTIVSERTAQTVGPYRAL